MYMLGVICLLSVAVALPVDPKLPPPPPSAELAAVSAGLPAPDKGNSEEPKLQPDSAAKPKQEKDQNQPDDFNTHTDDNNLKAVIQNELPEPKQSRELGNEGESKLPNESAESKEPKASEESNGPKASEELKEPKESDQFKGPKESEEIKKPKPSEEFKEPKESNEFKGPKASEEIKEPKASEELKEPKESDEFKGPKGSQESSDDIYNPAVIEFDIKGPSALSSFLSHFNLPSLHIWPFHWPFIFHRSQDSDQSQPEPRMAMYRDDDLCMD